MSNHPERCTCDACLPALRLGLAIPEVRKRARAAGYAEAVALLSPALRTALDALSKIPIVVSEPAKGLDCYSCPGCGAVGSNGCTPTCWVPGLERAVDVVKQALAAVGEPKKEGS